MLSKLRSLFLASEDSSVDRYTVTVTHDFMGGGFREEWRRQADGLVHRENGPAVTLKTYEGTTISEEWYKNGKRIDPSASVVAVAMSDEERDRINLLVQERVGQVWQKHFGFRPD